MTFLNNLTLASLPTDIIRMIFNMEHVETVDCTKLISPNWNAVALEFLSDRNCLPPIDSVSFDFTVDPPKPLAVIQDRYLHYFGLRTMAPSSSMSNATGEKCWTDARIELLFRRASRIDKLELNMERILPSELGCLSHTLGNVPVRNLIVTNIERLDTYDRKGIILFLLAHGVNKFQASARFENIEKTRDLLIKAMECVNEIDFDLWNCHFLRIRYWNEFVLNLNATGEFKALFSCPILSHSRPRISVTKLTK